MLKANLHQTKMRLSRLLKQVENGEEVIICRGNKPIAKIVGLHPPANEQAFGRFKEVFEIGPAFFEPMTEEERGMGILNLW